MKKQKVGTRIITAYSESLKTFKKSPAVFLPFIIFALFETAALAVVYFMPREPLVGVFGPLIRTFWDEKFLHFPLNFLLYPKLLSLSKMGLTIFIGSLLTGMAVSLVSGVYHNRKTKLSAAFMVALKRYVSLFIVIFIYIVLFYYLNKAILIGLVKYFRAGNDTLLFIPSRLWFGPILVVFNFIFAILVQSVFAFSVPILINETANPVKAIFRSFVLFLKLFLPTLVLVGLPMLIYTPKFFLDTNAALLMDKFFPEVVVIYSVLGIVLSSLIMDPLITVFTTVLYLQSKEE